MHIEMFQPVAVSEQTGDFMPLDAPTMERLAAEEQAGAFDAHAGVLAAMAQAEPLARGAVLEGLFMPLRLVFADGSVEELQPFAGEEPSANGHGPVEAPEGMAVEALPTTRVAVAGG